MRNLPALLAPGCCQSRFKTVNRLLMEDGIVQVVPLNCCLCKTYSQVVFNHMNVDDYILVSTTVQMYLAAGVHTRPSTGFHVPDLEMHRLSQGKSTTFGTRMSPSSSTYLMAAGQTVRVMGVWRADGVMQARGQSDIYWFFSLSSIP